MVPRKRGRDEMESSDPPKETSLLDRIRNMWEFACVMQYIFTFGKAVRIDEDFDIEDFETECLNPGSSDKLEEIGLTLLKWISSHRGLTFANWDEYTRRQYVAKAPDLNPYGTEEQPRTFRSFDIFQRIRVLHRLTRVEELGWDREERSYYVLDDSRLYRRTEPPLPATPKAKPKSNSLKAQAARRRASKRRRVEASETPEVKDEEGSMILESGPIGDTMGGDHQADTFGGHKWECVAVTCEQYQDFLKMIEKSRDPNEKDLHLRIVEQVLPVVEKAEESHRRKMERKQKELMSVQKLSGAKRSGRLADKQERERQEREAIEAAEKHAAELATAHKEQGKQAKMEQDRQSRMMTREQRNKDREYKRLLHEEELAKVAEEAKRVEAGEARGSERHLKAQIEKHKRDLEDLSADEDWVFDCSGCGVHGKNVDDGAHSVACEKCNVWQHSQCLGIRRIEAEKDDFHFVCRDCKRKIGDATRPNIKLKFRAGLSSSPPQVRDRHPAEASTPPMKFRAMGIPAQQLQNARSPSQGQYSNPVINSPRRMADGVVPSPYLQHAASNTANGHSAHQTSQFPSTRPASTSLNGSRQSHAMYPYPSNPPPRPSPVAPAYVNSHAYSPFQIQQQNLYGSQPASVHDHNQYPNYGVHQVESVYQQQNMPMNSTPQARPTVHQIPHSAAPTPNTQHQGRLPSPVLNRPSMSPTQGNPDVGPVAGVPQRSPTGTAMSPPPSQPRSNQDQNSSVIPQYHNPYQPEPYINGEPTNQAQNAKTNHHHHHHQYQHLSGLSPTKHSPSLPPLAQFTARTAPSPSPHLPSTISGRSISGTPIFPPTEMLQPSPKQLSKSPVPTPSKAMTLVSVGEEELKRVSEEVRDRVEEGRMGGQGP